MRLRLAARACAILLLIAFIPGAASGEFRPFQSLSPQLPVRAARFLQARAPQARAISHYATSSYLNWHCAGNPPLYIDLINAYPDRLIVNYFAMHDATPDGLRNLYNLGVTHILLKPPLPDEKPAPLALYLEKSSRWRKIYSSSDAIIWERRD